MKNVQIIDGADNCTYDVFAVTDKEFAAIFPNGADVEFIGDLVARVGKKAATELTKSMWKRPRNKKTIQGIHVTLFYQLDFKKPYYPTKIEAEMLAIPSRE